MRSKLVFLQFLFFTLSFFSCLQLSFSAPQTALQEEISKITAHPLLQEASLGIAIRNLKTGMVIAGYQENKLFIPASVQKLITWGAALNTFGPDHQFTTSIRYDPNTVVQDGRLVGTLTLEGGGDPAFFYNDLTAMLSTLYEKGIRTIRGPIVLDSTLFYDAPWGEGWGWDDLTYSYSSPISALAINENKITVKISPGYQIGTTASINMPFTDLPVTIDNKITTSNTDATLVNISYSPYNSTVTFTGTIQESSQPVEEDISIINPDLFIKNIFLHTLAIKNITVTDQTGIDYSSLSKTEPNLNNNKLNAPVMISHNSPLLVVLGKQMLHESNNFIADMLLKNIGAKCSGKGSFAGGTACIQSFLNQLGISENGYRIVDGSGLSRYNLISPSLMTYYLTAIHSTPLKTYFISLLPQPGQGTLTNRLNQNNNSLSVWAKTGSMSGISTMAGYLGKNNAPMFSFAIFINNSMQSKDTLKKIEDEIIEKLHTIIIGNNLVTDHL